MALLGKDAKIYVSAESDGTTFTEVGGINTIDDNPGYESADTSHMGDAAPRKQPSLHSFSGSASGVREQTDAGQNLVRAAVQGLLRLYVRVEESSGVHTTALCVVNLKRGAKQGPDAQSFAFDYEIAGGSAPTFVNS